MPPSVSGARATVKLTPVLDRPAPDFIYGRSNIYVARSEYIEMDLLKPLPPGLAMTPVLMCGSRFAPSESRRFSAALSLLSSPPQFSPGPCCCHSLPWGPLGSHGVRWGHMIMEQICAAAGSEPQACMGCRMLTLTLGALPAPRDVRGAPSYHSMFPYALSCGATALRPQPRSNCQSPPPCCGGHPEPSPAAA